MCGLKKVWRKKNVFIQKCDEIRSIDGTLYSEVFILMYSRKTTVVYALA